MEINPLNELILQLDTISKRLAMFKLILYSYSLRIIDVALYFTFNSIIFLWKADLPTLFQIIRRPETNIFFILALSLLNIYLSIVSSKYIKHVKSI